MIRSCITYKNASYYSVVVNYGIMITNNYDYFHFFVGDLVQYLYFGFFYDQKTSRLRVNLVDLLTASKQAFIIYFKFAVTSAYEFHFFADALVAFGIFLLPRSK